MRSQDVREGMELIYGGGPIEGGWFTVLCRVKVLRRGKGRFQVRHENGPTTGKVSWVTPSHLSAPAGTPTAPSSVLAG